MAGIFVDPDRFFLMWCFPFAKGLGADRANIGAGRFHVQQAAVEIHMKIAIRLVTGFHLLSRIAAACRQWGQLDWHTRYAVMM